MGGKAAGDLCVSNALRVGAVLSGVALAALAQMLALGMTGAGHGWITPFLFSVTLFLLNPIALLRLTAGQTRSITIDVLLIVIALILDGALYVMTVREGAEYFWRVTPFNWVWLVFWSMWQVGVACRIAYVLMLQPGEDA